MVRCYYILYFLVRANLIIVVRDIAYLSCPAHIEIMAEEKNQEIAKETEDDAASKKVSKKVAARLRAKTVKTGGGV